MLQTIIDLAKHYAVGRKLVQPADILAVIERESFGVLTFQPTDTLFKQNLHAAAKITGLTEAEIIKAITIDNGPYRGKLAKFRCEPGYWEWAKQFKQFKPTEKLLLSCSFGLGQKMARWLVTGVPQSNWLTVIRQFMGSTQTQVMYVSGDVDSLLVGAHGNRELAYTRYNAGPGVEHISEYGTDVHKRFERFAIELKNDKL